MSVSCSIAGVVGRLHPAQGVSDIAVAGFENVLLDMGVYFPNSELEERKTGAQGGEQKQHIAALSAQLKEKNLSVAAVCTPGLRSDTKRFDLSTEMLCLAKLAVHVCEREGGKLLIAPPLFAGIDRTKEWSTNREYYLEIAKECERADTRILLTNQCRNLNGHYVRGICADASVAVEWIEKLNQELGTERFGFCMDVGVCNLCGQNMQEMIHTLDGHLKAVIVRDNDGHQDSALLPFTGAGHGQSVTDWLSLFRGLRDIHYDGEMILNICDSACAVSPLLRAGVLAFAKSTADYLQWQVQIEKSIQKYRSIVLFGAGNMCRNFMKCYGQQYPPLFTCDNNPNMWGKEFCGLTVQPPEALLHIPKDCGVMICNVYYREIEQQLRGMGISNIEYFNDEYMPSFYFDRLEEG